MKVSCVTVPHFGDAAAARRSVRIARNALAASTLVASLACHRATPGPPQGQALATPPVESIVLRFPSRETPTRASIRQTLFNAGIQVDSENRKGGWMRAGLGGRWEGGQLYKQWYIVATYRAAPDSATTIVELRGIEQANSYLASTASRYSGPAVVASSGSARIGIISDATQGPARAVWQQMERVAYMLAQAGAERVSMRSAER